MIINIYLFIYYIYIFFFNFDSFSDLKPPKESVKYMKKCKIFLNSNQYQRFDSVNCGHLTIGFLCNKHGIELHGKN